MWIGDRLWTRSKGVYAVLLVWYYQKYEVQSEDQSCRLNQKTNGAAATSE